MLNFPFQQTFYFTPKYNIAVQNIVKKASIKPWNLPKDICENLKILNCDFCQKNVVDSFCNSLFFFLPCQPSVPIYYFYYDIRNYSIEEVSEVCPKGRKWPPFLKCPFFAVNNLWSSLSTKRSHLLLLLSAITASKKSLKSVQRVGHGPPFLKCPFFAVNDL